MPIKFKVEMYPTGSFQGWYRISIIDGAISKFVLSPSEFEDLKKQMENPIDLER